ncbi:MAG: hypothetical protein K0R65_858 [Crocinitomicaceae bacterium]|jgi:hypothetical protein|nr:hypothetical protein [Crocinitomicaceae bacterium]
MIKNIIDLPEKFYALGNVSIYSLLKETGYFEIHSKVTEENIIFELSQYPEYVDHWLGWSNDKRSGGWYFQVKNNGKYLVGHYPLSEAFKQMEFNDPKEACAAFIKREIEEIRLRHIS